MSSCSLTRAERLVHVHVVRKRTPPATPTSRRKGFSLIELLVVVVIIALLAALLFPALQQAREAASRIRCVNNLKQLGIACHNYHEAQLYLPVGQVGSTRLSAHSLLLPHLEQSPLYQSIRYDRPVSDPLNRPALMQDVAVFRCPSESNDTLRPEAGARVNYMANKGSGILWRDATGPNTAMPPSDGVMYYNGSARLSGVTDGLSNTAFFSERILGDDDNNRVSPIADVFVAVASPLTQDEAAQQCNAIDTSDLSTQYPIPMGAPWLDGQHCYLHVSPPNTRSCNFQPVRRAVMPPSSHHTGGVNLLLGDGSVRFVANRIDLQTWRGLGSRSGGEVLAAW